MSGRFEVVRLLGRGGQGSVELVRDRQRGELLARKRLVRAEGYAARTLKHESRVLEGLTHPNLVHVYEVGEDATGPYLLMEHVEGRDIVQHCGGPGPELAAALPQLLSVLEFLHERGLAHGDLTPANVLVRRDGWVKLLDFGLAGRRGDRAAPAGGTLAYVAPERRAGGPPSPAADRYGLGAILAHVVTGQPPEGGAPAQLPSDRVGRAIQAAMHPDPERRPDLTALERELLPVLGAAPPRPVASPRPTLDRPGLTARVLGTVLARPGQLVLLRGPSGVGKSTVARAVARGATEAGLRVTWARARPEERVAFNLIDALVDELTDELARAELSKEASAAARRAAHTFPALARLVDRDPGAEQVRRAVHAQLFGARPPARQRLFQDLRTLLTAGLAPARRLLVVDDLQWADADSAALLDALLDELPPELTVLGTLRSESTAPIAAVVDGATSIDVPLLPVETVAAFVEQHGVERAAAERVAEACGGLPLLVDLALREPSTDDPVASAARALLCDGALEDKQALAMLLVSGRPLQVGSGISAAAADRLEKRGLVVRTQAAVDIRHDALRAPLATALGNDWLRAAHEKLAVAPAPARHATAERVRHLEGAGRFDEAAAAAREAADDATRAGAHGLAADLYAVAARVDPGLGERRAHALERALRYDEAAQAWSALHDEAADAATRRRFGMAHAHALLSGRRIAEGRAQLDAALRESGQPGIGRGRPHQIATALRLLAGPTGVPLGRTRVGVPAAWRLLRGATVAGYFDTLAGLRLLLDARDSFIAGGEPQGAAWCELLLAFFVRFGHPRGRALSRMYRQRAERRLVGATPDSPVLRGLPSFLDAYDELRAGRFARAAAEFDQVLELASGTDDERTFEVQLTTSLRTSAVLATQDLAAIEPAVARFAALAREGVEVAIQCHVENARTLAWTWRGRFEEAAAAMDRLRDKWPRSPPTVQALLIETYAALPTLLLGDPVLARSRLRAALDQSGSSILHTAYGPIVAAIASACELSASLQGAGDPRLARRWAELACRRPSLLTGLGHRVIAALELHAGRVQAARARYRRAELEAERRGQPLDVALARFGRGQLEHDSELQASARHALAHIGASPRLTVEYQRLGAQPDAG